MEDRAVTADHSPDVRNQRAFGVLHQFRALMAMTPRQVGSLLLHAYNDWVEDGAARLGAALAYCTLFSIAPVLVVLTGVLGLFVGQAAARGQIAPWLEQLLSPQGARAAELMLQQNARAAGGIITTVAGLMTLFLGTSALVHELRQSLNALWRVGRAPSSQDFDLVATVRSMLSDRVYAFLIVIGSGLLIMVTFVVNAAIATAGTYFSGWLPLPEPAMHGINFTVSLCLTAAMFTLVYRLVPDAHVAWGDACVGAVVTAFLFNVGGTLLSIFVGKSAASVYGTAASVLALLVWVYYSAQVVFYGAEFTRIFADRHGGRIVPVHHSLRSFLPHAPVGDAITPGPLRRSR